MKKTVILGAFALFMMVAVSWAQEVGANDLMVTCKVYDQKTGALLDGPETVVSWGIIYTNKELTPSSKNDLRRLRLYYNGQRYDDQRHEFSDQKPVILRLEITEPINELRDKAINTATSYVFDYVDSEIALETSEYSVKAVCHFFSDKEK